MDRKEATKLIDEVQAVGSARGWGMLDKLLDLIDRVEKIEREACAKVCDCYTLDDDGKNDDARRCARAIRARSNAEVRGCPPHGQEQER